MDGGRRLHGTVLVTGGTRRIGKAIAERLRADGWRVLTSSHKADAGADIVADLAEPSGAVRLYASALEAAPDLCAIVNNAALFDGDDATLEAVNLIAPRKLTTLLAGREGVRCAVVNIIDSKMLGGESRRTGGCTPCQCESCYARTKRELLADTRKFAALFSQTLRVNAVAPGPVLPPTNTHEPAGEMLLDRRPTPDDVAGAVAYLLGAEAVTGVVIPVDSGQHLLYSDVV